MPEGLSPAFSEAVELARELHAGQVRKGTEIPYLSHLLAVASLVLDAGGSEQEAIAALLHDAAEDAGGQATLERIRRQFGDGVAGIVAACSDTLAEDKEPWPERKQRYIAHLDDPDLPDGALLVSLADKLHNARAIVFDLRLHGDALWERFRTGSGPDQLWYYRSLAAAFARRRPGELAGELTRTVDEMARLAHL
ncbi:MAG TPA: HD domain-containing protein [Solirubrobacteraceae bacterium]